MMKVKYLLHMVVLCSVIFSSNIGFTSEGKTLLGVFHGKDGWAMQDVEDMEEWLGKKHAVVNLFTNMKKQFRYNLFNYQLPYIWSNGNVPMITFMPSLESSTPDNIEELIVTGEHDAYLNEWASQLYQFLAGADAVYGNEDDRRAYLRLGHEMNGNWYAWSASYGQESPDQYIAMWRHIHKIFSEHNIDKNHLQWVWCVSAIDYGGFTAEQYYPGDDYVDWLGIDGYNWGKSQSWSSWKTPAQVFDNMLDRIRLLANKPVVIAEVATTTVTDNGVSEAAKNDWISDYFKYLDDNDIAMTIWFNIDKEADWQVFGGVRGDSTYLANNIYTSYRNGVGSPLLISADNANPQILTDMEFKGEFSSLSSAPRFPSCIFLLLLKR